MSPEVPETVKKPPLENETRQGHEGADPKRALARVARLVFLFVVKIIRTERERERKKNHGEIAAVFHITTAGKFFYCSHFFIEKNIVELQVYMRTFMSYLSPFPINVFIIPFGFLFNVKLF